MRNILEDAEGAVERGDTGPGKANRDRDKPKFPKRFYENVTTGTGEGGYLVLLDERPIKTPGRAELLMPSQPAAELVAGEWAAVSEEINPLQMPVTRLANTAVDGIAQDTQAVMEDIVRYAASDLLCYRADSPEGLVENQRKHWDPVLDWLEVHANARFDLAEGIMHVTQPKAAISGFGSILSKHEDPFRLASLHTFTTISGSALLALALADGELTADETWNAAHVDEDWNISQWGEDHEAAERRKQRWTDFEAAYLLLQALGEPG